MLQAQYEAAKKKVDELTKAFNQSARETGASSEETQRLAEELRKAEAAAKKAEKQMEDFVDSVDDVGDSAGDAGDGLDDLGDSADNAGGSVGNFWDIFKASFLSNLALKAIEAIIGAIKNMANEFVEAGKKFTTSMSQVAATMGMTVNEVNNASKSYLLLEEAAKQAGATTAYSASEAADALNYLALAGYSAEQAADALPAVLNLAAAGGLDLAYASDLATDAMSASCAKIAWANSGRLPAASRV